MTRRLQEKGRATVLTATTAALSLLGAIFTLLSRRPAALVCSFLAVLLLLFMLLADHRPGLLCRGRTGCRDTADEREAAVISLKTHLSEQRHDVFNLLQLIYGFTQLKRPEKVLELIRDYCGKMENIGRLYNAKCIKLADLLYTKEKEAGVVELGMDFQIDIDFEPDIVMLEHENYLYAVNGAISNFFFWMHRQDIRNGFLSCHMKALPDAYKLTLSLKESPQEGGNNAAEAFKLNDETFYWRKISGEVPAARELEARCGAAGIGLELDERNARVSLEMKRCKNVCRQS